MSTLNTVNITNGTDSITVEGAVKGSAKAWVNFNGTGTVAIRASYNVSSITDNGVGDYTVNFTTAMVDANYSPSIFCSYSNDSLPSTNNRTPGNCIKASSSFRLTTTYTSATNGAASKEDLTEVNVAIFR